MVKRLQFKGDPAKKKVKKSVKKEPGAETEEVAVKKEDTLTAPTDSTSWVRATDAVHINGPTILLHSQGPSILNFHSTLSRPHVHSLSDSIEAYTPSDIASVWVASKLSGTDTITLRSADGKFLAADQHGTVTALNEARGPNEQWRPIVQQDSSIAWMSHYDKFLSIDEVAGGSLILRADSDSIGFAETWSVKVQAKFKYEGEREKLREEKKLNDVGGVEFGQVVSEFGVDDELQHTSKFQAYSKEVRPGVSQVNLRHAKEQGRLNEALLDRRSKTKSDKFC